LGENPDEKMNQIALITVYVKVGPDGVSGTNPFIAGRLLA
jgi:hypothetical protein